MSHLCKQIHHENGYHLRSRRSTRILRGAALAGLVGGEAVGVAEGDVVEDKEWPDGSLVGRWSEAQRTLA